MYHRTGVPGGNAWSDGASGGAGFGRTAGYGGYQPPQYAYKGAGLLDGADDPRGLKKRKTMMAKVATHGVKILVVALALVGCFGWLWTHKHKKALHAHLDTTLGHLTSAESDKSRLRRLLSERDDSLKKKDQEISELRSRLDRLTAELGNSHNKHSQHAGKMEQDLLDCKGELLVQQGRVTELEALAREQERLAAACQEKLEAETHKQVQGEEAAHLRQELQDCQLRLQKSAAGNLDQGFLAEQQKMREQEAAAKAKLHASATPDNVAQWRGNLPPGPAPVPAGGQAQQQAQQAQQEQAAPAQQQQQQAAPTGQGQQPQAPQDQQPGGQAQPAAPGQQASGQQQAQRAPGQQQAQQAPGQQQAAPGQQAPTEQAQQAAGEQQQAPAQDAPQQPTGKRPHATVMQRLREARLRRQQEHAARGHHALSQLEQALGRAARGEEEEEGEAIEQHPERQGY